MIDFKTNILLNENPSTRLVTEAESGYDNAYTDFLECMVSLEEEFFEINKDHYISMHHGIVSESSEIVMEGAKDMMHSAAEFFKKMIKKITTFFANAMRTINSYLGDFSKFIKKHGDSIKELEPDFDIYGYKFTIDNAPDLQPVQNIVDSYMRDLSGLEKKTKEDIEKERDNFSRDANIAELRGKVLRVSNSINGDKYREEVRKHFRNDKDDTESLHIDKARLREAVDSYNDLNNQYKEASKMKNKTIVLLNNLKDFFEKGAQVNYSGNTKKIQTKEISIEDNKLKTGNVGGNYKNDFATSEIISKYFNMKYQEAKIISSIVSVVATEKVVALKDSLKQEREIVRGSMKGNNAKKDKEAED